jgi:sulfide:quinone oxidoreductase
VDDGVARKFAMADRPFEVLIIGGGYAAFEATFRLQRVAGSATQTTILTPDTHVVARPMAVLAPFVAGHAPRVPLAQLAGAAAARLRHGRMISVDVEAHHVVTDAGETIAYDALLIAIGAVQRIPPAHVLAFGSPGSEERMHGLIQDLEGGYVRKLAFVVPARASWPLALYELALMSAERAYDMCQHDDLMLLTAEPAPLAILGEQASRALTARLYAAGVTVRTAVDVKVPARGLIEVHPGGERLTVDRIVTLPLLDGPAIAGLPHDEEGFLAVDEHGRVEGVLDVYAAGDVTHHPIKQVGLACQQADAAADMIAVRAGVAIEPQPYTPVLEGVLLTERATMIMRREKDAAGNDTSVVSRAGRWRGPTKAIGRELAAHLAAADPQRTDHPGSGRVA